MLNHVWDAATKTWIPMTQPGGGSGSGMSQGEFIAATTRGAGNIDSSTQRVTLAADGPAVTRLGDVVETAPASDTASSGLNGRLQRIAQRLTSLIGQLPAALGIGAASTALRVVLGQGSLTDRSGSITTGGTAQQLMAANANRLGWKIQNTSTQGPVYFNATGTASTAGASFMLAAATSTTPGGYYESPPGGQAVGAISILGATTGQTFAAREW